MAKDTRQTPTGTLGELAPAAERVALDAAPAGAPVSAGTATAGSVAEAAALLDTTAILREVPGPGVGAERVADRVETVRDRPVEDAMRPSTPPATPFIDPEDVPGRRRVEVATRITHDGLDYTPDHTDPARRSVLLDFKQYSELAAIGAVIPLSSRDVRDWADDED